METLKDLWASLIAGMRERTTNPLTVAFILSWSLWNYKFFVVILGNDPTTERLKTLGEIYPLARDTYMGGALLYPAISALLYVFIYPLIGMVAIWVYRKYQVTTANLVKNAEKARTITPQERDALVRTHEKERKKLTDENEALSVQLTAIRATLDATSEELKSALSMPLASEPLPGDSSDSTAPTALARVNPDDKLAIEPPKDEGMASLSELEHDKVRLLLHLSKYSTTVSIDVLTGNLKMNPTLAKSELRELEVAELVRKDSNNFWGLTDRGAALVVNRLKKIQNPSP